MMFVITATSSLDDKTKFYTLYPDSINYGYWTPNLCSAYFFSTFKEALDRIDSNPDFIQINSPHESLPRLICLGAGLSYDNPEVEKLLISICEVKLDIKKTSTYRDLKINKVQR